MRSSSSDPSPLSTVYHHYYGGIRAGGNGLGQQLLVECFRVLRWLQMVYMILHGFSQQPGNLAARQLGSLATYIMINMAVRQFDI
jgi:hypothetical protein